MVLEWDKESVAFQSGLPQQYPPRASTIQTERFCPICKNPKSRIDSLKNIKKLFNKNIEQYRFLLNHLKSNNLKDFTIKELIKTLNPNITDGSLQQRQLANLIILGYIKKDIQEWATKKGKRKMRYLFSLNETVNPPVCYNTEKDKHNEFVEWERKTYFDPKANKERGKNNGRKSE